MRGEWGGEWRGMGWRECAHRTGMDIGVSIDKRRLFIYSCTTSMR